MSNTPTTSVSVDGKGQGRVEIINEAGIRITVYVAFGGDYVSVDAYRDGEPVNNMDIDFEEDRT